MSRVSEFVVAIPARYASTRLPGKPLALIAGEPMVLHVARRALDAGAREVWVATDDARIAEAVAGLPGIHVAMTDPAHASGTDRLAECARQAGWADDVIVVNLQGDEPFAPAAGIQAVAGILADSDAPMSTLATLVEDAPTLFDPNVVKLVRTARGDALYFSRAPIPWHRDGFAASRDVLPAGQWLRHIGIYGYRAGFIRRYVTWQPSQLEQIEMLEQLRVLWHGEKIHVDVAQAIPGTGVDTAEDLARVRAELR